MVTELLGELIAVHHAADFAARRAARGEDDALRRERLAVLHAGGKGAAAMAQLRDHTAGAQLDLRPLKRVAQHIEHRARHVAHGIDPPRRLRRGQQAEPLEPAERLLRGEALERRAAEVHRRAVVVRGGCMEITEVTAAVARREELAPDARLPLGEEDAVSRFRGGERRGHARRAPADHEDGHDCASSLRRVR